MPRGPAESEDGPRRRQPRLLVPGKGDGGKGTRQSGFRPWRHNPSNSNNSCHIKSQMGFKSHLLPVREPLSTSEVPCREVYSKFPVTQLISSRTRSRVRVYALSLGLSCLVLKQTNKKMRLDRSEKSSTLDMTKTQKGVSKRAGREGQGLLSRDADPTEKRQGGQVLGTATPCPLSSIPSNSQDGLANIRQAPLPCLAQRKVSLQVTEPICWVDKGGSN